MTGYISAVAVDAMGTTAETTLVHPRGGFFCHEPKGEQ